MTKKHPIRLKCSSCDQWAVDVPENVDPEGFVTCNACGGVHTLKTLLASSEYRRQGDEMDAAKNPIH